MLNLVVSLVGKDIALKQRVKARYSYYTYYIQITTLEASEVDVVVLVLDKVLKTRGINDVLYYNNQGFCRLESDGSIFAIESLVTRDRDRRYYLTIYQLDKRINSLVENLRLLFLN